MMDHRDHVGLLAEGITRDGSGGVPVWADFGSGGGAFTLALAELLGDGAQIHSIDRDSGALREQDRAMRQQFPRVTVHYHTADFTRPLDLPPLDGIIMANALHFIRDREKVSVVRQIKRNLRTGGRLVIVEYDTDKGNMWVPHPFSYPTWEKLARESGFAHTKQIGSRPSRFLNGFYSAVSW